MLQRFFAKSPSPNRTAVIGSTNAVSSIADLNGSPSYMSKADFDQAFSATGAQSRPVNTPANREKLRAFGWKLIGQTQAQ